MSDKAIILPDDKEIENVDTLNAFFDAGYVYVDKIALPDSTVVVIRKPE